MVASSRIALVSALAASASAAAIGHRQDAPAQETLAPNATWQASGYQWGCSPGGCIASFSLVANESYASGAPGFNVVCNPVYIQENWVECHLPDDTPQPEESKVWAAWIYNADNSIDSLKAAHVYQSKNGGYYQADAAVNVTADVGLSFDFPVLSVGLAAESHQPPETVDFATPESPDGTNGDPFEIAPPTDIISQPLRTDNPIPDSSSSDPTVPEPFNSEPAAPEPTFTDPIPPAGENIPIQTDLPASENQGDGA
ncbi:hypothetical protein CMUS01_14131 [Colletotrichum musicola]|uniref:Uncharacterized protein n=1 Tax=Colletotrichum musicola TaxID=2175873 RepID=A0A8H6J6J3_9PEZI|nr:hypothetical protein CMUS01_14131 [Colletotrichum musicola]